MNPHTITFPEFTIAEPAILFSLGDFGWTIIASAIEAHEYNAPSHRRPWQQLSESDRLRWVETALGAMGAYGQLDVPTPWIDLDTKHRVVLMRNYLKPPLHTLRLHRPRPKRRRVESNRRR